MDLFVSYAFVFYNKRVFCETGGTKKDFVDITIRKIKKLILNGYLFFGFAFLFIDSLIYDYTIQRVGSEIKVLLLGNTIRVIWFFLSLFIVEILFACSTLLVKKLPFRVLICVFLVVLGFVLGRVGWNYFRIGSSFYAYGFYFLGYLANKLKIFKIEKRKQIIFVIIAIFINILGTIILLRFTPMVLDINSNSHHDILVNYMVALGGSYMILFFSLILSDCNRFFPIKILGYVGKDSFFFFTITNYVPEAFATIVHNESKVSKLAAYVIGIAIACALSEVVAYLKGRSFKKEKN